MKRYAIFSLLIAPYFLMGSCSYLAREAVFPNSCQVCEVIDEFNNVVWSEDECGGGVANMEDRCKIEAYDRGCLICNCRTYKKDEDSQ